MLARADAMPSEVPSVTYPLFFIAPAKSRIYAPSVRARARHIDPSHPNPPNWRRTGGGGEYGANRNARNPGAARVDLESKSEAIDLLLCRMRQRGHPRLINHLAPRQGRPNRIAGDSFPGRM